MAQFRKFWTDALPKASAAPAAQRRAILEPVATDPALSQLVDTMRGQEQDGYRGYGVDIVLSAAIEGREKSLVLVRACLDSSNTGLVEVKTQRKVSPGRSKNPVRVNLKPDQIGTWRVSYIDVIEDGTC